MAEQKPQAQTKPGVKVENPFPYGAEIVLDRNDHNQKMAKYGVLSSILSLLVSLSLTWVVFFMATQPTQILSYMMDDKGHVVPLQPLRNPTVTDAQVLNWAKDRVVDLHTFTFTNWRTEVQRLNRFFVDEAFESFIGALKNAKTITKIESEKLIVTAAPASAPVIIKKGEMNGVYLWTVEMPIIQTIEGGSSASVTTKMVARMVVQRVPRTETLDGIKIRSYLVKTGGLKQ